MKSQNYLILFLFCLLSFNVSAEASTAATNASCAVSNDLTLTLNFDAFPEQNTWTIRDANYNVVMGSFGYTVPNSTTVVNIPSLASGDYLLVVMDVNGDGMGSGSYELKDSQGNILVSGGNFTTSDVNEFCVVSTNGGGLDVTPPTAPLNLTASNPTQTTIDIAFSAGTDNLSVAGYVIFMNDVYIGDIYAAGPLGGTISNLTPNTAYTFKVATIDIAGNFSPFSNTATETTLSTATSIVFHEGYFETGWDGWVDGGNDCYRYSGAKSAEGSYSIRLRDDSGSSKMTLNNQDVSQFTDVTIDFEYFIKSFESNEDFWLRYYDGISWQTVATFQEGVDFTGNGFYSGSVSINNLNYDFVSNAGFRFQCDASANNDKVFIDKIIMTGEYPTVSNLIAAAPPAHEIKQAPRFGIIDGTKSVFETKAPVVKTNTVDLKNDVNPQIFNAHFEEDQPSIQVYPNPAHTYFNLSIEDHQEIESLTVLTFNGKIVKTINPMLVNYDISDLNTGIYIVAVVTKDHSTQYLKLVKTQ